MRQIANAILDEVSSVVALVDDDEMMAVSRGLKEARRIFVYGEGRSGLMGKAIAMRLMHGGKNVYVVGETITPSIGSGDLFLVVSGSGSSASIQEYVRKAKEAGAKFILVTTSPGTSLMEECDQTLIIPAATKQRRPTEPNTIQPLGNQFDQSVHLVLDAIVIHCLAENGSLDLHGQMADRHANLE